MNGWVLRLIGAALALCAGYGWGALRVERACQHTHTLDELAKVLDFIRTAILYREMDSAEILRQLQAETPLNWLSGSRTQLYQIRPPKSLPPEQYAVFAECFSLLGRCGAEEAVRHLEYCLARCETFRAAAAAEEQKAKNLYRQIGLCMGALAVLFLL